MSFADAPLRMIASTCPESFSSATSDPVLAEGMANVHSPKRATNTVFLKYAEYNLDWVDLAWGRTGVLLQFLACSVLFGSGRSFCSD